MHRIAPYLQLDRDPYMVTTPDGLFWMLDAYTTSDRYPYSEPYDPADDGTPGPPFNYIRNSVKVVVNAYDGSVALYVVDPDDPVIEAYAASFPTCSVHSQNAAGPARPPALPGGPLSDPGHPLRRLPHAGPAGLLQQGGPLDAPLEKIGDATAPMEPYYVLMRLPGEDREEFLLMLPFTPQGRDNMIAWLAARSDLPDYGKLVATSFRRSG